MWLPKSSKPEASVSSARLYVFILEREENWSTRRTGKINYEEVNSHETQTRLGMAFFNGERHLKILIEINNAEHEYMNIAPPIIKQATPLKSSSIT